MTKGKVKKVTDKLYGFITIAGSDPQKDVFYHENDLGATRKLVEGDEVEFEIDTTGPKGPRAVQIKLADAAGSEEADASDEAEGTEEAEVTEDADASEEAETTEVSEEAAEVAEESDEESEESLPMAA